MKDPIQSAIVNARGTINALRLTATKRPGAETDRLIRDQKRRIADLEAQQALQGNWTPSADYIFEGRAEHEYRLMYA